MSYNAIHPGKVWLDTSGKPIQAHGFSVFYNEQEKLWYWYGENKEKTVGGKQNTIWHHQPARQPCLAWHRPLDHYQSNCL